jgi:3-phosphoshikimate 1-carboxyvinyltransferase
VVSSESFAPVAAPLHGVVRVPGSKSVSNRALVCAALAAGESRLTGVASGDDTIRMVAGLQQLGADIEVGGDTVQVRRAIG